MPDLIGQLSAILLLCRQVILVLPQFQPAGIRILHLLPRIAPERLTLLMLRRLLLHFPICRAAFCRILLQCVQLVLLLLKYCELFSCLFRLALPLERHLSRIFQMLERLSAL